MYSFRNQHGAHANNRQFAKRCRAGFHARPSPYEFLHNEINGERKSLEETNKTRYTIDEKVITTRIYMDVCCLNRPFDTLSQDRVYLEAEAVLSIISHCESNEWVLIASGIIDYELSKLSDAERLDQVQTLYAVASERIRLTEHAEQRASFFQRNGLKPFDSLHLALAEVNGADVFLTTDDRLLREAKKLEINIDDANPVSWLMEVRKNER